MTPPETPSPKAHLRVLAWEITRRCNLSCVHCRAHSVGTRAAEDDAASELSLSEIQAVLTQVAEVARPMLIVSGGEPLLREDLLEIIGAARGHESEVVVATNGTLLTAELAGRLADAGVRRVSISLDGATASTHDAFRQSPGAFAEALRGIASARRATLPFQVNMTLTDTTAGDLPDMVALCRRLEAAALHLFVLVPTGRARLLPASALRPAQYEQLLERVCELAAQEELDIKVTCGPQFARVARQSKRSQSQRAPSLVHQARGAGPGVTGCLAGVNFCFVGAEGEVQPCGYFQVGCGNVREQHFRDIWEGSPILRAIRDRRTYKGKCGRCEYVGVCGGCRARAYEGTGDFLEADPLCAFLA